MGGRVPKRGNIASRKREYVELCLDSEVEAGDTGLSRYRLVPESFPELSWDEVDTSVTFLGRGLSFPFVMGSMAGGMGDGGRLNRMLAVAAQEAGVALGLGSLRPAVEDSRYMREYDVREDAPDVPVLGNVSVWQLRDRRFRGKVEGLAEQLGLDGMFVHVNPAQEVVQQEGERDFRGALSALLAFVEEYERPVILKEVGVGLSSRHLRDLVVSGVAGFDVAGRGGTDFPRIEGIRRKDAMGRYLGRELAQFGISTADALLAGRRVLDESGEDKVLIASGGIRTAHDAALSLALGADLVSAALPVLRAAREGKERIVEWLDELRVGLTAYLLLTGSRVCSEIRGKFATRQ